jgi:hypothetical protein
MKRSKICNEALVFGICTRLGEQARSASQQPEEFWQLQHAQIRGRIASLPITPRKASRNLAWGAVPALGVLALLLLAGASAPAPHPVETDLAADADQQLLEAVEQAMQSGVPVALEPASVLAVEIGEIPPTDSQVRFKETKNEN